MFTTLFAVAIVVGVDVVVNISFLVPFLEYVEFVVCSSVVIFFFILSVDIKVLLLLPISSIKSQYKLSFVH